MFTAMNRILSILATVAALVVSAEASDFPKGSPKFVTSYRQALSKAEKEGKPLVIVFSAAWCPPCQQMKKNVYPSAEVSALHDKFVWAYLDVDESGNSKAAEKYGVNGIPHIEFLDKSGKSIGKQVGGTSPTSFVATLNEMISKSGSSSAK